MRRKSNFAPGDSKGGKKGKMKGALGLRRNDTAGDVHSLARVCMCVCKTPLSLSSPGTLGLQFRCSRKVVCTKLTLPIRGVTPKMKVTRRAGQNPRLDMLCH